MDYYDNERNHISNTYTVERKIHVDAPASAVYKRIGDFHRWPAWSPYEELDPGMDRTYAGAESSAPSTSGLAISRPGPAGWKSWTPSRMKGS
jgi:hypothetical protein